MKVSTTAYEFAHGKKPRGTGQWAFFFDGETDVNKAFWHTGSFSEAKEFAQRYAASKGHTTIQVGS